ncbi:MAG: hypothetical protein ACRBBM_18280 [Pseudomonadaceae bacterium]
MDWREIDLFRGIDLNDSFVLGWHYEGDRLVFNLEVSVWPESKYYYAPKDGEYTCYRKGNLIFEGVKSVRGLLSMAEANRSTDATGECDYGNIDTLLIQSESAQIIGDFGSVEIAGGTCALFIST